MTGAILQSVTSLVDKVQSRKRLETPAEAGSGQNLTCVQWKSHCFQEVGAPASSFASAGGCCATLDISFGLAELSLSHL